MRIGLISDTHIPEARDQLWPQVYKAFSGVDAILHGGDIHDVSLLDTFTPIAPTWAARGNGEDGSGGRPIQPDHPSLQEVWELEFEGFSIGLMHELYIPEIPPHLTVTNTLVRNFGHKNFDIVVYGDTHVERIDTIEGILCVNPGSPTYPRNLETQLGTIGFIDIQKNKIEATIWQLTSEGIEPFNWNEWREPR
jgi:putative phosphoesterase